MYVVNVFQYETNFTTTLSSDLTKHNNEFNNQLP